MNTLEVVLARRKRLAAQNQHVAMLRGVEKPKPRGPKPGNGKGGRPQTHGHEKAYRRHIKANETPCDACIAAHELDLEQQRIRWRERKAAG